MNAFRALSPFVRRARSLRHDGARCELCSGPLSPAHGHVLELERRALKCACRACALLFRDAGAGRGRFRTVPERVLTDGALGIDEVAWSALELPVRLAFLVRDGRSGRWSAFYPSPGGSIESPLSDTAGWALLARVPLAALVEPDVEALLVHHARDGATECLLAPVDACYELVGLVRSRWRGFDGGDEARAAIEAFFAGLRARGRSIDTSGDTTGDPSGDPSGAEGGMA